MSAREVSKYLKINEKNVYKLARGSNLPSMKIGGKVTFAKELIDKWIVGNTEWEQGLIVTGCDDDVLRNAVDRYNTLNGRLAFYAPVGNINGLKAVRDSRATLACLHLPSSEAGKDDLSYVSNYLREEDYVMAQLFVREQGIIVQAGNPKRIKSIKDIVAKGAMFVNRKKGSGTRLLFDTLLKESKIDPASINGYDREVDTHFQVAIDVLKGTFDAGFGEGKTARTLGLHHVPLCEERVCAVIPEYRYHSPDVKAFLEYFEQSF